MLGAVSNKTNCSILAGMMDFACCMLCNPVNRKSNVSGNKMHSSFDMHEHIVAVHLEDLACLTLIEFLLMILTW